ncbi:MAG: hypothetical protein LBV49_07520 [Azonexus sp.]|jgi:hypothetical protein|nr:hypothetical protein [Azonexus sp.]
MKFQFNLFSHTFQVHPVPPLYHIEVYTVDQLGLADEILIYSASNIISAYWIARDRARWFSLREGKSHHYVITRKDRPFLGWQKHGFFPVINTVKVPFFPRSVK